MKQIAFLSNFEACNKAGDTVFVDAFIQRAHEEGAKAGLILFTAFKVGEHNEHEDEFYTSEQAAWEDEATFFDVHDTLDETQLSVGQALMSIANVIRGLEGNIPIPTLAYMGNDENSLSERDHLEAELFFSAINTRCMACANVR